eukprot:scaffold5254_cov165-Amphora_coffeaeformis.AAC.1
MIGGTDPPGGTDSFRPVLQTRCMDEQIAHLQHVHGHLDLVPRRTTQRRRHGEGTHVGRGVFDGLDGIGGRGWDVPVEFMMKFMKTIPRRCGMKEFVRVVIENGMDGPECREDDES